MQIQADVAELEKYINTKTGQKKRSAFYLMTYLSSEVGELCDEVIGLEGGRVEDPNYQDKEATAKEIVDVIFNAIRVANHYGIDLDAVWEKRLAGIKAKF